MKTTLDKVLKSISDAVTWLAAHPYLTVSLVGLLVSYPLIFNGLPPSSHDAIFHVVYSENFSHQLALGEIYPRWLYLINGGLGGPTFYYYQPAPYYYAFIFKLLPVSLMQQLGIAAALGIILSGITTVLWLREIANPRPALLGASVFLLMPYPVGHDVYIRSAFGDALAFVLLPLILFFAVRIIRGGRLAVVGLTVCYGALCLTHMPITLIFSGIPVLYVLFFSNAKYRLRNIAVTIGGMTLGAGLAATFIIPAVAYQEYAFLNELREGQYAFAGWLMSTKLVLVGTMNYFWMAFEVCLLAVVCFIFGYNSRLGVSRQREMLFWLFVLGCSLFMMFEVSSVIWETFIYLQSLQFPFRFNSIISIAALPLIVLAISTIRRPVRWYSVIIILSLAYFSYSWANDFYTIKSNAFHPKAGWKVDFDANMGRLGLESHGRWPRTVPGGVYDLDKSLKKIPLVGEERAKAYFATGTGNVTVLGWQPRDINLHIESAEETTVNITQFYFPGWRARVAGSTEDLPIRPSQDLGLINITVPPGNQDINISLKALWPEFLANCISLLCGLLTIGLFIWLKYLPQYHPKWLTDSHAA